jgi:hypothetical protein
LLDKLVHVTAEGTVKYKCSNNSKTADYESPNAAHPEIYLIAHRLEGEAATWRVQKPGLQPLSAHTFATNTGSIGGSQGLQWVEPDGSVTAATLSYSDVVEEYGPKTIWIALLNSDQKAGSYHVLPTALICGADAETFRDG